MEEFKLIAHGGIWDSKRIAKCIALGSNGVGIGTGFLISMGCTLVQDCYTNTCPAGLTGSYEKLNIQSSVKRIVNYIKGTRIRTAKYRRFFRKEKNTGSQQRGSFCD